MSRLLLGLFLLVSAPLAAQNNTIDSSAVYTIDGIVNEVLSIISGKQGKERDWEQFRQLFLPTAQFAVLYHKDDGTKLINTLTLEEWVRMAGQAYENDGFLEYEISKKVDEYNGIAQVFIYDPGIFPKHLWIGVSLSKLYKLGIRQKRALKFTLFRS